MNDLDLIPDGGELQPYSQPNTPLSPQDNEWSAPAPDALTDYQPYAGSAPQIFGVDLPPGTTMDQAHQAVDQAVDVFRNDMVRHLKQDSALVDAACHWYKSNCFLPQPDYQIAATHHYHLPGVKVPKQDRNAWTAFLNYMDQRAAPSRFILAVSYWLSEASKRQTQQQPQQPQQQYPSQDDLTEAEWKIVEARCESDKAACDAALRNYWGSQYKINMSIVKEYMATLPVQEREYLELTVCKGGVLSGNSPEVIVSIYKAAIGTMPRNGAGIAAEIAQLEKYMRENRSAYNRDTVAQARLRHLYDLRGY